MLPWLDQLVNLARAQIPLSCSIGEPAFPSRPGAAGAAVRNGKADFATWSVHDYQ